MRRQRSLFGGVAGAPAGVALAAALMLLGPIPPRAADAGATTRVIVQASGAGEAAAAVRAAGGRVTRELPIVRGAVAELTAGQAERLATRAGVRLVADRRVELAGRGNKKGGGSAGSTHYPTLIGADRLHAEGVTGYGVTVAVVDSGLWPDSDVLLDSGGRSRLLASYDVLGGQTGTVRDGYGHGTHVSGVAVSRRQGQGKFDGIAPDADLVSVRAFDESGVATYADVVTGLQWLLDHQSVYGIRVVNLSFSAPPRSYYWEDPINQAVMELWRAGMVVVASAGNGGPQPMTIGVPANLPYLVTVGAMTDNFTAADPEDDYLASFSAAGPTYEGFVKPEIVAPGGHVRALMDRGDAIARAHPEFHDGSYYFEMSGTSQAAAVVSGVAALMLQQSPQLTPDEVKYRLMASASPATNAGGTLIYSIFQQGAGLVNAYEAVRGSFGADCLLSCDAALRANQGLDIDADLAGLLHFSGPADAYDTVVRKGGEERTVRTYFVTDALGEPLAGHGFAWSGGYARDAGFLWSDGFVWSDGFLWADGYLWSDGFVWADGLLWADGYLWSDGLAEPMSVNVWVPQQ